MTLFELLLFLALVAGLPGAVIYGVYSDSVIMTILCASIWLSWIGFLVSERRKRNKEG